MVELGAQHLDAIGEDKAALELPRGNATVEEGLLFGIVQTASNDQLIVFDGNAEIFGGKPCNRESDLETLIARVLDVVRRIRLRLGIALEEPLDVFEAQKKRAIQWRPIHAKPSFGGFAGPLWAAGTVETVPCGHRFTKKMWCLFGTIQGGRKGAKIQPNSGILSDH